MSGGLDILIIGIANKNLDYIAADERLRGLFDAADNASNVDQYIENFHALARDPTVASPKIFYLQGEHLLGSQLGAGLGYVIFDGNNGAEPRKLDEGVYHRIDELKQRFIAEVEAKGLLIPKDQVGVYALNVYDT